MASTKTLSDLLIQHHISNGDVRYMSADAIRELNTLTVSCVGSIREKLFWLQQGLSAYPNCATCGKPLSSKNFRNNSIGGHYTITCSVKCAKRNPVFSQKVKQTNLSKYGAEFFLSSPDARRKIVNTNMEKYGSVTPAPWGSEAFKKSMLDKHGAPSPMEVASIREVTKKSLIENNILSGKTEASIRVCQSARNVECINAEDALSLNRDILENIDLMWRHRSCGHTYVSRIRDGLIGSCPKCHNSASVLELSLRSMLAELVDINDLQFNVKGVIPGNKELDIYIPSKKLAIEFNGIYWHSTSRDTNRYKHLSKTSACEEQGIKLIHIWEHHFLQNKDAIRSILVNALGLSTSIAARKCTVHQINSKIANNFLATHHLNGYIKTKTNYALMIDSEIVAVMSFGPKRFGKKGNNDWEILRFASKFNHQIQGGASKLFAAFVRDFNPSSVMSYSDRCLGGGDVYLKMGMKELPPTPPSYFWANASSSTTLSRYKTQKHKLPILLGDNFDTTLSEDQNMKKIGWFKLWDCGNRKFVLDRVYTKPEKLCP